MLKAFFAWFDAHPEAYWVVAGASALAWVAMATREARTAFQPGPVRSAKSWLPWLLLATLLAWRWPYLLAPHQLSPDESQQIAGALTLVHDPVFWRSVDGSTAGPLDYYILLVPALFGLPIDFFSARLVGLLLAYGALLNCRRILAHLVPAGLAWLAITPGVAFFAAASDWDFIHYSTEHLPLFLITGALAALTARTEGHQPARTTRLWVVAGIAAGALPWAKLQAAPLAAFACLVALFQAWSAHASGGYRRLRWFVAACAAPSLVISAMLLATGQVATAWQSYIVSNFAYVSIGLPWLFLVQRFWLHTKLSGIFPAFVVATTLWTLAGFVAGWRERKRHFPAAGFAAAFLALSCVIVVTPRRDFPHYLLFLVPSALLLAGIGMTICLARAQGRPLVLALLVGAGLLPFWVRSHTPLPGPIGLLGEIWRHPYSDLGKTIRALSAPGDALTVWGWLPQLHVETGLPQGTRDAHAQRQIEASPVQDYYRQRFLADLVRNRPRFFVDSVGPADFSYAQRELAGHETFPELQVLIATHYRLVGESQGARVYLLRDPGSPSAFPAPQRAER